MADEKHVEGGLNRAKGEIKQGVGDLTGDTALKNEGRKDEAKGRLDQVVGDVKDAVKHATK